MSDKPLHEVATKLKNSIESAALTSKEEIEKFRILYLGQRNGQITKLFKHIPKLRPQEQRAAGILLNALRTSAISKLKAARRRIRKTENQTHDIDLTLPGRRNQWTGSRHPITQALASVTAIFTRMGFTLEEGPEIEDDWHNFTALNFPVDHPARDMQDTLFIEASENGNRGVMLRTHTSPVQIRAMMAAPPPFRLIAPGRVYRNESITYKSYCLFHQVEGLVVDEGITMADLKHTLYSFSRAFFGDNVHLRFRPSYFPFTEPSAELDVWWELPNHPDGGQWMEILGSGMVHPNVLNAVGIDSERFTGFAFGMGVERPAMLRYGIEDIRTFYENDLRFLTQF